MSALSTLALLALFVAAAAATWIAGVYLSKTTDALDRRLNLGEAFGGMVLLAIAGTLPEVAITVTAVLQGNLGLAAGNLIGGIAVQTVVLVVCDIAVREERPLSYLVGSLIPVLEASLVVFLVGLVFLGAMLPPTVAVAGVSPASVAILVTWLLGLWILQRVRNAPSWELVMHGAQPGRPHRRIPHPTVPHPFAKSSTSTVALVFLGGSVVTLLAGVLLAGTSSVLADRFGISGIVFGATVLAAATALPEISTGIAAVRLGDNQLAMGDIFGGNAFQVCLFIVADLIAGKPVLPSSGAANGWLAGVGILLTIIYLGAVIVRPERRRARLGADSIIVLVVFAIGIAGLAVIAK